MTLCLALSYGGARGDRRRRAALARGGGRGLAAPGGDRRSDASAARSDTRDCRRSTASSAPRANSGCRTSCSGSQPTPSCTSPTSCGRTSRAPSWTRRWRTTRPDNVDSDGGSVSGVNRVRRPAQDLMSQGGSRKSSDDLGCTQMRWQSGRRSDNVEDRRGVTLGRGASAGARSSSRSWLTLLGAPQSVVRSLLRRRRGHRDRVGSRTDRRRKRGGRLREGGPGEHRRRLGRGAAVADRPSLRPAQAGAVHGGRAVGVRHSRRRGRAVLLPARFTGVPGSRLLR